MATKKMTSSKKTAPVKKAAPKAAAVKKPAPAIMTLKHFAADLSASHDMAKKDMEAVLNDFVTQIGKTLKRGTLRGMHYAVAPSEEAKVVRCVSGAIFDVVADLREPAFGRWAGVELTAENGRAVYIPAGCAHGFITLTDHTDVFYQMGDAFRPETARGFRWDDKAFGITWPLVPTVMSSRDAGYADFETARRQEG